jgi:phage-related protein
MRTGLAPNADAALDLITKGLQSGADKSQDFLDTLNEYSTQFRKLGVDGETATGLLSQGLKGGARDADVVADSLKEFSIRAVDGSKTTAAGFKALGLNATDMAKQIAAGGPTASKGLDTVLDRLRGIKDPVKQSAAAVQLFGTQAEDMGKALFALDPSSAAKGLGDVAGAADKANKAFNATPTATIKTFGRSLQQGLVNVLGGAVIPALNKAIPAVSKAFSGLGKVLSTFTSGLSGGGAVSFFQSFGAVLTGKVIPAVSSVVSYFVSKLVPIYQQLGQIISQQVLPVVGSLARFFTGTLLPAIVGIYSKVASNLKPVLDAFYATIQTRVLPAVALIAQKFREWQPTIQKVISVTVLIIGKVLEFAAAILGKVLPPLIRFAGYLITGIVANIIKTITSVASFIKKLIDFGTAVYNAGVSVVNFVGKVVGQIQSLGKTWGTVWTNVKTNVSNAINTAKTTVTNGVSSIVSYIGGIPGKVVALGKNFVSAGSTIAGKVISGVKNNIGGAASAVTTAISGIPSKIAGYGKSFASAGSGLISDLVSGMKGAGRLVSDIAGNVWSAVKGLMNNAISRINAALSFTIGLPLGQSIHIDPPDIPQLAGGARATGGTLAVIGEGREPETVLPDSMLRGLLERTAAAAAPNIRVFIGDTELTDIVRVQVDQAQTDQVRQLAGGRRL